MQITWPTTDELRQSEERMPSAPPDQHAGSSLSTVDVTELVKLHYRSVWKTLHRLGVASAEVEDAAQKVFIVLTHRLAEVIPGRERAFLMGTTVRIAADMRRSVRRRRAAEDALAIGNEAAFCHAEPPPRPDECLDQRQARDVLDSILAQMPLELSTVFVLYELEEMEMNEIAAALSLPRGTVASRLRRSREHFEAHLVRIRAKITPRGGR